MAVFISTLLADNARENIINEVLIKDTKAAIQSSNSLLDLLHKKSSNSAIKEGFNALVFSWKKVETVYVAGELEHDAIDIPRYIDVFHNLKEDLNEQMQRVRDSKDDVSIALFKNSFKTINALEYILFSEKTISPRDTKIAQAIVENIKVQLEDILAVYTQQSKQLLEDETFSNGVIMNALVESSYKLKEWRVADVAGVSLKYKNQANLQRAEYGLSHNSVNAIRAILLAHQEVLDAKGYYDFGDMYEKILTDNEVQTTRNILNDALKKLSLIQNDDLTSKEAKDFYEAANALYNNYFMSLIQNLKITSKILDADGD